MAPQTTMIPESSPSQPHKLKRYSWLLSIAASGLACFLLWKFSVPVERSSLILFIGVMAFLLAVYIVYGRWRPAPVLSNLCGAIAVASWSSGMAGIISLVGLRHKFPLIDDTLASVDRAAGLDLPSLILWFADQPFWANLLAAAYNSSSLQLFALIVFLAITQRFDKLWQLAFVCSLTVTAAASISMLLPAKGALAHFAFSSELLDRLPEGAGTYHLEKFAYFRSGISPEISFSSLQGVVTFPSFHFCMALMTIFATIGIRWLFGITLIWNALVLVSTVPIGGHYVIDLVCGALLWLAATAMATAIGRSALTTPAGLQVARSAPA